MSETCIHLAGYFDRNFGDDMMMKLVVSSLPEITFLVDEAADTPLLSEPNVAAKDRQRVYDQHKSRIGNRNSAVFKGKPSGDLLPGM